jgi:hypothetical protein
MGDRTVSLRPPTAQYTNWKRHRFDRLMNISDIIIITSTLMVETEEFYETLNFSEKLIRLIAREDFSTSTRYDT